VTLSGIRAILGMFFLGTTGILGGYIILLQGSWLLPISEEDATSAFQIIIPTFLAQVAVVWKAAAAQAALPPGKGLMPRWLVLFPPITVLALLTGGLAFIACDHGRSIQGGPAFKKLVTLCVSILAATSVVIISRVCGEAGIRPAPEVETESGKTDTSDRRRRA
jgi:hypothetical protein